MILDLVGLRIFYLPDKFLFVLFQNSLANVRATGTAKLQKEINVLLAQTAYGGSAANFADVSLETPTETLSAQSLAMRKDDKLNLSWPTTKRS